MNRAIFTFIALVSISLAAHSDQWPATTALDGLHTARNTSHLDNSAFAGWKMIASESMDSPVMAFGAPLAISGEAALAELRALAGSQVAFDEYARFAVRGKERIHYREQRDGSPVITGRIELVYNQQGNLFRWSMREHSAWPALDGHYLSLESAAQVIAARTGYAPYAINEVESSAAWYPDHSERVLRPVYWIRIEGEAPHERHEAIVDAVSGEIIIDWSGIHHEQLSGDVSGPNWPEYMHEEPQVAPHAFGTVNINSNDIYTATDGSFTFETGATANLTARLRGPYVQVENEDGPDGTLNLTLNAPYDPQSLLWTTENASSPELNLFYHTMFIKLWMEDLDPDFTALDYPVPAVANVGTGYDNAYWNGFGTYYGSGGQYNNFAMYSDVIYHEYTHGVTDGIYPAFTLPYIGESGALNEAWSDYIACTINLDPLMADWIGGTPHGSFRDLESNMVYPDDWAGEVHADSPFISAALWRIRDALGAEFTDNLMHFARYGLAETFFDYFIAVLEEDDDDGNLVNGTPNSQVIYNAFGAHGIGPGDQPNMVLEDVAYVADGSGVSEGDGDRFVEQGETVALSMRIINDVLLYPPPAQNVTLSVTTETPGITVVNGTRSLGEFGPQDSQSIEAIELRIAADAADTWATFLLNVTANDGAFTMVDTLEFTVGTPRMLVVLDDENSQVENFVTRSIRAENRIFEAVELIHGATLPDLFLPEWGMIIWLSGNAQGSVLTSEDQWKLRDFVNAGNKLVLSGQYLAEELRGTVFASTTLEVEIQDESTAMRQVTTTDAPFPVGEWYLLAGSGGASNQQEMSVFTPAGNSRAVARYGADDAATSIVEFASGNGLLIGFGIESISDETHLGNTDRATFMEHLYAWGGDLLPVQPELRDNYLQPHSWSLGPAYPNPFNSSTSIPFEVPTLQNAGYRIYDVLGRVVAEGTLQNLTGEINWLHNGPSGIYFLSTYWQGGQSAPRKLVLLK